VYVLCVCAHPRPHCCRPLPLTCGLPYGRTGSSHGGHAGHRYGPVCECVRQAIYLHIFSDAFSSVAVICSALLVRFQGWVVVDALQCLVVAGGTLYTYVQVWWSGGAARG
jgi:hypothetical protein